jgi:hypothetical protein
MLIQRIGIMAAIPAACRIRELRRGAHHSQPPCKTLHNGLVLLIPRWVFLQRC